MSISANRKGMGWVGAASLVGGALLFLLRGCWHTRMSWPIRRRGYSYQVCLACGIKRLFDDKNFHGYGSFGYDLKELIAKERATRMKTMRRNALAAGQ